nr:putative ribonuclease H-like domain-containing protein [Tanacetum cinerariifolium]
IDNLDIDDLYNNLKVYEADIKGSPRSSSNSQNAAFVSTESTSSANELNVAYSVSTATGLSSQAQGSSSYADELMFLFFTNQSSSPQLDNEDLEQIDQDDLEEMDLKWQVKCFNCHRRGHFSRDCRSAKNSRNRSRDAGNTGYRGKDNGKRPAKQEDEKALVVQDGLGYDSPFNEKEVLDIKEEEVTETVFDNRSSDEENSLANDRFKISEGYHVVPPSLTGNYMPPKSDVSFAGLDDSIYKLKISETVASLIKDEKDAPETSTVCVEKPKEDSFIFTRSGKIPVSAAKPKAAASTSAAKPVNTAGPKQSVNFLKSESTFHKSHSPIRRSFYSATTHSRRNSTERVNIVGSKAVSAVKGNGGHPHQALKNKGIVDSRCSRNMTGNKAYLADYQEINDGGFVAFGSSKGKITGKGNFRTEKLDFDDVYFVNKLQFNLFSVSQMCDKKNSVLLTETECLVLSPNFKLLDESQVLLRLPRQSNMCSFDLQNVVSFEDLTCLFAKASIDESNLWHRRLGHVNVKTMNKLVKRNLVKGLPLKIFENDHTCVACQKRKQHKATCKAKLVSSVSQPLQILHMNLFGPTSIMSYLVFFITEHH